MGELRQESHPHIGATVWVRGETFKAGNETADLRQPKWNENQTVLAAAIHTPDRNAGLLEREWLGAGDWGLWSNLRARAAVDCRERDRGDAREEIVVKESQSAMEARRYC